MTSERESEELLSVSLPGGTTAVSAVYSRPAGSRATIVIAHGAGAGYRHPFLNGFARGMHDEGVATLRFNFPYMQSGRRMPGPAAHSIATWAAASAWALARSDGGPVWASGKSYGGRMASMAAADRVMDCAGLVYLGYPLHPPGDPSRARVAHLPGIAQPQLFVEGTNDPFVDPHVQLEEAVATCQDARIAWVEGAGHSFEVKGRKRPADEVAADLAPIVAAFLRDRA